MRSNFLKIAHKQAADADSQHFSVIALSNPPPFHHPLLQLSLQHKHLQQCCHSAAEEVTCSVHLKRCIYYDDDDDGMSIADVIAAWGANGDKIAHDT